MVKEQAYVSFKSKDDIAPFLLASEKYTDYAVLSENDRAIDVIFYNYALAETSTDNYGWRYVIRWLSEEESDALGGIHHSDPTSISG
ncbi:hypothetical protein MPH47_12155 [Psychrobacillus psychrodurans]|uniref:hypothetical protein n=1 Tax=Psychrobacillus psychrodurans TaxID=126157 RepID=UPI001F4D9EE9|nr:hypothetical protein [Psychrobacillus psychrodurans]MCK1997968.1 hypothetical protein [Psychrobacillus psychrodurans]